MRPKPITPKPGQESVWNYPRPPALEKVSKSIEIIFNGASIVRTNGAYRVLETSHPPVYYLPPADIRMEFLKPASQHTHCEWKGTGSYYHLEVDGKIAHNAAWFYHTPHPRFAAIKDFSAFYANQMDRCLVDGEEVIPQPGEFYGGWITPEIVGPFKGIPGSWGW